MQAIGALLALQAIQVPAPTGYVNDFAGVIPASSVQRMTRIIDDVRAKSGGEIVVVTLSDIGPRDAGQVALEIGRQWKVGQSAQPGDRARNTGVIILLVPRETQSEGGGHLRIETGQGTEGFITDGQAGDIIREATALLVSQSQSPLDYGPALELMTARVAARFAGEFGFTVDSTLAPPTRVRQPAQGSGRSRGIPPQMIMMAIFFAFLFLNSMGSRRGRRGRGGCGGCIPIFLPFPGGFGGGYGHRGGFGGGGFGGEGFGGGGFGGFGGGGGFGGRGAGGRF